MSSYIKHYGAKGMHWGERRYQNLDGSLTDAKDEDGLFDGSEFTPDEIKEFGIKIKKKKR